MSTGPSGLKRPREEPGPAGPAHNALDAAPDAAKSAGAPPEPGAKIDRALKDAALNYLEEVKRKFKHDEKVYNSFLDIMKDFQSRRIKTEGVIERVSQLFKGDRALILGFNTFLPDGYKIPESYADAQVAAHAKLSAQLNARQAAPKPRKPMHMAPSRAGGGLAATKGPELEYAKRYVQKIKKRFENSEQVYNRFLNILQSYQEENKSVKTVYEEVRELFAEHRDLLAEFAQFLPAPEAQAQEANAVLMGTGPINSKPAKRQRRREEAGEDGMAAALEQYKDEMELLYVLREQMSRRQWEDLLKVFNLYSNQILSAPEMVECLRQLNTKSTDISDSLLQFMKMFCGSADMLEGLSPSSGAQALTPPPELGPSYSGRSNDNTSLPHTRGSAQILNVSCPMKPPEGAVRALVSLREGNERCGRLEWNNPAENALWDVEDQQHQLDLLIHQAASAEDRLKLLYEEVGSLSAEDQKGVDLSTVPLDSVLHMIDVVYGAKAPAVSEALYKAPAAMLPVVLQRVHQKAELWAQLKLSLAPEWEACYAEHHQRAQDHAPHQSRHRQLAALALSTLLEKVSAASATGLVSKYNNEPQDSTLNRMLEAAVSESDKPRWESLREGWLLKLLAPAQQAAQLAFVPGQAVGVLLLHQYAHEAIATARSLAAAQHPQEAEEQFQAWISAVCTVLQDSVAYSAPVDSTSFDCTSEKTLGKEWHTVAALTHAVKELLRHALGLLQSSSWPRVLELWESCKGAEAPPQISTEQYRASMCTLLPDDCYRVAVNTQRQLTVSLCRPSLEKPPVAAPAVVKQEPAAQGAQHPEAYPKLLSSPQAQPTLTSAAPVPAIPAMGPPVLDTPIEPNRFVPTELQPQPQPQPEPMAVEQEPMRPSFPPAAAPVQELPSSINYVDNTPQLQETLPTLAPAAASNPVTEPPERSLTMPTMDPANLNPFGLGDIHMAGTGDL